MFGLLDKKLPPIKLWTWFAIIWFIWLASINTNFSGKIKGIPSSGFAVLIVLAPILFLALAFIGPIVVLMLLLPFPFVLAMAVFKKPESYEDMRFIYTLRYFMFISFICLCGLILTSIYIRTNRTPFEFIEQWGGTVAGRRYFRELIIRGRLPGHETLPDLRMFIKRSQDSSNVQAAAEVVSHFGQRDIDTPLLLEAMERCEDDDCRNSIASSLKNLSGIDLPDNTPPEIWREKWELIKNQNDDG